jgi:hypothetical protein
LYSLLLLHLYKVFLGNKNSFFEISNPAENITQNRTTKIKTAFYYFSEEILFIGFGSELWLMFFGIMQYQSSLECIGYAGSKGLEKIVGASRYVFWYYAIQIKLRVYWIGYAGSKGLEKIVGASRFFYF